MVVEGLDVGEDAHGVWFTAHDHHVFHLDQPVAACLHSGDTDRKTQVRGDSFMLQEDVSTTTQTKTGFGILSFIIRLKKLLKQHLGTMKQHIHAYM